MIIFSSSKLNPYFLHTAFMRYLKIQDDYALYKLNN